MGKTSLLLNSGLLETAARASVRCEIAEEVGDYSETGVSSVTALVEVFGELPELRDAISLVWRILILWLAVIALFVIAGWVS
jgi:AmpE protein